MTDQRVGCYPSFAFLAPATNALRIRLPLASPSVVLVSGCCVGQRPIQRALRFDGRSPQGVRGKGFIRGGFNLKQPAGMYFFARTAAIATKHLQHGNSLKSFCAPFNTTVLACALRTQLKQVCSHVYSDGNSLRHPHKRVSARHTQRLEVFEISGQKRQPVMLRCGGDGDVWKTWVATDGDGRV